jgi:hypothetical protein
MRKAEREAHRVFVIVGAPPARNKTVVLRVMADQDSSEAALRNFMDSGRGVPVVPGWLIRAIPILPVEAMNRAAARFFIDSGQPPGPGVIDPMVREFRQGISDMIRRSLEGDLKDVPVEKSQWGRKR